MDLERLKDCFDKHYDAALTAQGSSSTGKYSQIVRWIERLPDPSVDTSLAGESPAGEDEDDINTAAVVAAALGEPLVLALQTDAAVFAAAMACKNASRSAAHTRASAQRKFDCLQQLCSPSSCSGGSSSGPDPCAAIADLSAAVKQDMGLTALLRGLSALWAAQQTQAQVCLAYRMRLEALSERRQEVVAEAVLPALLACSSILLGTEAQTAAATVAGSDRDAGGDIESSSGAARVCIQAPKTPEEAAVATHVLLRLRPELSNATLQRMAAVAARGLAAAGLSSVPVSADKWTVLAVPPAAAEAGSAAAGQRSNVDGAADAFGIKLRNTLGGACAIL